MNSSVKFARNGCYCNNRGPLLLPDLPGDATRLLLETDGPLHALPFALLPDDGVPMGIRRALVRVCPTAPTTAREFDDELVIVADATGPGRLPGARREAKALQRGDPGAAAFLGRDATESRAARARARVLHVAAHTTTAPDDPAILLATDEHEDGRWTVFEIRGVTDPPEVVVLSSCESLLTDVTGRDAAGDVGTAFLDAGAGSVIGALWRIEDASAAPFLTAVHAALRQGVRPSEALRRARQELAAHGSADADAFGWGAFQVRGSDEALPPRTPDALVGAPELAELAEVE
jgi:CHAT domain-containing protein